MPDAPNRPESLSRADRELDARIRAAFEPPPGRAEELVASALADGITAVDEAKARRSWPVGLAAALGAVAVLAAVVARLISPGVEARPPVLTIANHDGVVTVESVGGTTLIIAPRSGASTTQEGVDP